MQTVEGADAPALTSAVATLALPPAGSSRGASAPATSPPGGAPADLSGRIKYMLSTFPVLLFMKGSTDAPKCGFSARVVAALQKLQVGQGVGVWVGMGRGC